MNYQFKVKSSEHGKRLDAFLHSKLPSWSHRIIKNAINRKRVFINQKNIFISGWNLKKGDRVLFRPLKGDYPQAPEVSRYQYVQVIYEDPWLLATHKPPFVDYDSFVSQVNLYLKRHHREKFYPYLGQMHRLDKETSGLLLFTKKKSANVLAEQFRQHQIRKYYLALVEGRVEDERGLITDPIAKGKYEGGRKARIADEGEGKESCTEYAVEERYESATLLRILLKTGRTHQIRVHMASIGHPVMGDKLYRKPGGMVREPPLHARRQMLHAHRVELIHPISSKKMKLTAPIPDDMNKIIDALRGI